MFDALKNLGDLPGLMAKAKQMQESMERAQEELARRQYSADAAGGVVSAVVNGKMELVKLRIDKTRVNPADTELLEDLIVASVRAAQVKAARAMQEQMSQATAGLGLPPDLLEG